MSDRLIERHIVEQFASTLRDPGEQQAAMRELIPGVSSLNDLFVTVEAHHVKMQRLQKAMVGLTCVEAAEVISDSEGEGQVVAAYSGYVSKDKDFRRKRSKAPKFGEGTLWRETSQRK